MPVPLPVLASTLALEGAAPAFRERVAGTAVTLDLVAIPACDGVKAFHAARTEVPWELFDAFIYGLDAKAGQSTPEADAVTRPTKPYVSVDRGFGHQGWPAISMSSKGAVQFCEWLSRKTGRTYRLPTVAEWRCMAKASAVTADTVARHAWTDADADVRTHRCGEKAADAAGLVDLWGNAAEWCVAEGGGFCILGGSYRDERIDPASMKPVPETPDWNESDPQFPKSVWWLVDGPFIGMRVVTSDGPGDAPRTAVPPASAAPGPAPAGEPSKPAAAPSAAPAADHPAKPAAPNTPDPKALR
jgi:hypothetical protein